MSLRCHQLRLKKSMPFLSILEDWLGMLFWICFIVLQDGKLLKDGGCCQDISLSELINYGMLHNTWMDMDGR